MFTTYTCIFPQNVIDIFEGLFKQREDFNKLTKCCMYTLFLWKKQFPLR